ncbi:MAG: hypothetical protein RLZZ387_5149 [Chloroflexota bacterium]|jgi:cytoskeletal protein RodZ
MVDDTKRDERKAPSAHEPEDEHEAHLLPKGALVMMLAYLALLTLLWVQVYLQLLTSGGIPRT